MKGDGRIDFHPLGLERLYDNREASLLNRQSKLGWGWAHHLPPPHCHRHSRALVLVSEWQCHRWGFILYVWGCGWGAFVCIVPKKRQKIGLSGVLSYCTVHLFRDIVTGDGDCDSAELLALIKAASNQHYDMCLLFCFCYFWCTICTLVQWLQLPTWRTVTCDPTAAPATLVLFQMQLSQGPTLSAASSSTLKAPTLAKKKNALAERIKMCV